MAEARYGFVEVFNPAGVSTNFIYSGGNSPQGLAFDTAGNLYIANLASSNIEKVAPDGTHTTFASAGLSGPAFLAFAPAPSSFFKGGTAVGNGVSFLSFPNGNYFGYYAYLDDPHYFYHFDLGYEYVFDASDGEDGVYLYDFASATFFYTSPTFPLPYLYDFNRNAVLYYFPDPSHADRYNTDGVRYFYEFPTGKIITK